MTSEVTQAALEPCPFCRKPLRVVPSLARAFDPPRPLVEYHHADGDCIIKRAMWAFYDDEPEKFAKFAAAWNTRLTAQSGEGRSGAGEDALRDALDSAHFYIDASPDELADLGITRDGALRIARDKRAALNARQSGEGEREALRREIINTPETADFMAGVPIEAAHQRERWGADHDAGKTPFDWFWLIGYLAQKAATSAVHGNIDKALHHTISTAAALANWHAALSGADTAMRPGIAPPASLDEAALRATDEGSK